MKGTMRKVFCCAFTLVFSSCLVAQDACTALLKNGIFNTARTTQRGISSSTISNRICTNYSLYKQGKLSANANGSYELYSASASFSSDQVEAIGQAMCSANYSDQQANSEINNFSSVVSSDAMSAFRSCMTSAGAGLIVETTFSQDDPEIVKIDAHYSPLGHGPANNRVGQVQIKDDSGGKYPVSCSGSMDDASKNHGVIDTAVLTMTCKRPIENDPNKAFPIAGVQGGIAYPASVTVDTDIGSIFFEWGAMFLPPPVSPMPPAFVGEIRAVSFQTDSPEYTTLIKNGWHECDGSVLNAGDYPELYQALGNTWGTSNIGVAFKLPDLRGEFLRGWNHGSGTDSEANARGSADPANPHPGWTGASGDAVGSRQQDAMLQHAHSFQTVKLEAQGGHGFLGSGLRTNSGPGGWNEDFITKPVDANTYRVSTNETRPKNVTVMYVIYLGREPKQQ
jgi:microcystin-dependent protein